MLVLHVSPKAVAKTRGRCLENRPWACRINNGFKEHCGTMKKPFAWGLAGCARDQPCASWVSRSPTSRLNDRRLGLALVVQRSGQVRGSAHARVSRAGAARRRKYRNYIRIVQRIVWQFFFYHHTQTHTQTDSGGYRELPKPGRACAPTRSSKTTPRAPVFVASGGVTRGPPTQRSNYALFC